MYNHQFFTALAIVFILTSLDSCDGKPANTPIQINETGHQTVTTTDPPSEKNSCGKTAGTGSVDYEKSFTVDVDLGGGIGVGTDLAKASVTGKYSEGTKTTIKNHHDWEPGKNQRLTITWYWQEWTGDLLANGKQGKFVARFPISSTIQVVDLACPVMDLKGVWLTPFKDVTYNVVAQAGAQVTWIIPNRAMGQAKIDGNLLINDFAGDKVTYEAGKFDPEGNPTVLTTSHPDFGAMALFRTCPDFEQFMHEYWERVNSISPEKAKELEALVKSIQNPTCPNLFP